MLRRNCRNTAEVFRTSCAIMGLQDVLYNDVHGEKPTVSFYQTAFEIDAVISDFVSRALSEGLAPDDIVVLSATSIERSWVESDKVYGGATLSTARRPGTVFFTTIRKFKGLEAKAVLIVDASMLSLRNAEVRRLLYVGASRAKNLLHIAMLEDAGRADMATVINGIASGRSVPKNKRGLKRLLKIA